MVIASASATRSVAIPRGRNRGRPGRDGLAARAIAGLRLKAAVNDGKLVSRLRLAGRLTTETEDRVRAFISRPSARAATRRRTRRVALALRRASRRHAKFNFRFYDNRHHPRLPAVRLFDAGTGDGTVLARAMRSMHSRFQTFYIVGKEISLEDVRLALEKMLERLYEHRRLSSS